VESRLPEGAIGVRFGRSVDLHSSLAPLGRWGDDLIDRWDGSALIRSLRVGSDGPLAAVRALVPEAIARELRVEYAPADRVEPEAVAQALADTFLVDDPPLNDLCRRDRRIAALAERHPGIVAVLVPDPFPALIRSISAQQVNLRWAATIRARIARRYGRRLEIGASHVFVLEPPALAATSIEALRELQLTTAKARAVIGTARAAMHGELRRDQLATLDDEQLISHLTTLPGIGRWSAEWFLARTLGRPRVVAGDLGVRKAVARLYDVPMPSELEVRRLTEHWGPAATLAQTVALHDLAVSSGRAPAG
jgi:DNA-3-methyladenine glycosylase II